MTKTWKYILAVVLSVFFIVPVMLFADPPGPPAPIRINNPLSEINDIPTLITTIVDAITTIGYYIVVIFIIYAGFKFVTARGNDKELGDAKNIFLWTVIGAAVLLGASILSTVIKNTVTEVGGVSSAVVEHIQHV